MNHSGMTADIDSENAMPAKSTKQQYKSAVEKLNTAIVFAGTLLFKLRKIVMAVPVVYAALRLASYNRVNLPEQVGINIQSSGEFAQMITRDVAVIGPLGLTIACLLLMFCSRKALYPWAVSIFTLILPLLILFSNIYPA